MAFLIIFRNFSLYCLHEIRLTTVRSALNLCRAETNSLFTFFVEPGSVPFIRRRGLWDAFPGYIDQFVLLVLCIFSGVEDIVFGIFPTFLCLVAIGGDILH